MYKKLFNSKNYFHDIIFCDDAVAALKKELKKKNYYDNIFYVVDENVEQLWGDKLRKLMEKNKRICYLVFQADELSKNYETTALICRKMMENGFGRDTVLISIGGGVVSDIAGFAASIYMRGIQWISVPTTLLAMVDASIGGKTGVNLDKYKNMIGTFFQPDCLIVDPTFLKTLPQRELKSGIGEILKYALLIGGKMPALILMRLHGGFTSNQTIFNRIVNLCISCKVRIVREDEFEAGVRKALNLGHTTGHALEKAMNFKITHGEAVVYGLLVMLILSKRHDLLSEDDFKLFIELILTYNISRDVAKVPVKDIVSAMYKDKKNRNGRVNFVLISSPNEIMADCEVDEKVITEAINLANQIVGSE